MTRIVRYLKTALLIESITVPVALLYLSPHWPKTILGWLLVIIFGPPLWFLGESLFEWATETIPSDSVTTIVYIFIVLLLMVGVCILFSMLLGDYLRPHFY